MAGEKSHAIPPFSRWLIEAAAILAPGANRRTWKREWLSELWHAHASLIRRGLSPRRAARRIGSFALGAFADAGDLRKQRLHAALDAQGATGDPCICIAGLLLLLITLVCATNGFRHCRMALRSPYPQSHQLVLLSRSVGVVGIESAAPLGQVQAWARQTGAIVEVAGFVLEDGTLEVTPNFFEVLQVDLLRAGSGSRRFLGRSIERICLLPPRPSFANFAGAIARLPDPARKKQVEAELAKIGTRDPMNTAHIGATFLDERNRWPLYFAAGALLLSCAVVGIQARRPVRFLGFFAAKALLLLLTMTLAWAELATSVPIPVSGGVDTTTALVLASALVLSQTAALRWSISDQARRCPVCCRLVAMPVSIGSQSSLILDRPGVEFLCVRGHGSLLVSGLTSCTAEPARWTAFDRSWEEVFARGGHT